jgi:hypothetical protein
LYRDPNAPRDEYTQDQDPFFRTEESKEDLEALANIEPVSSQTLITEHTVVTHPAPPKPLPTARIDKVMDEL